MQKDQILNIANSKSLVRLFIFSKVKNSFHYKIIDMYIYWGSDFIWSLSEISTGISEFMDIYKNIGFCRESEWRIPHFF